MRRLKSPFSVVGDTEIPKDPGGLDKGMRFFFRILGFKQKISYKPKAVLRRHRISGSTFGSLLMYLL